jgi:hypothetical protein
MAFTSTRGDNLSAPDPEVDGLDLDAITMQTLTADRESDGLSCLLFEFPPDFAGPRHHHDCDQIIYIVEGSMRQGNRVLGPGAGFYTRAGASYNFRVGPAGVRFLEFRPVTTFDTIIDDPDWPATAAGTSEAP